MISFLLATLLSAFLLFQVQPIISKTILPWFGGSPAVWTTCMLFFQVLLFGGYAYAHLLTKLRPSRQAAMHCSLLFAAACGTDATTVLVRKSILSRVGSFWRLTDHA